jgi:oligopeptide transport system substrate-binding protein
MEFGAYKAAIRRGEYTVARASWLGDYPDPTTFLDVFTTTAPNNQTGFSDPTYDLLVTVESRATQDPARRAASLRDAERRLLEAAPVIPVYHYVTRNLVNRRVRGFHPTLLDHHPPKFLAVEPAR